MKIAILGQYPLDTNRLGGVEVAIVYVQRELLKRPDVDVHIVTCKTELDAPRVVKDGRLTITYLPRGGLGRVTWHRDTTRAMHAALDAYQPDIIHAHSSGLYAGAALTSGYPTVVTVHGIASLEAKLQQGWKNRLRGVLDSCYERWVIRRTRHLMVITPYVNQVFEGIFKGQSYLVENACETRFFDIVREPVAGRLFFAGPVIPRKGVLPLVQALAKTREEILHAHLRVAGSLARRPDYVAACQDAVQRLGLGDAVEFLGHLAQEQVIEEYRRCEAFVLPSVQETAPMVIEQAMAAAVPSVATLAGGVPWMIEDGVTGLTLPIPGTVDGDPDALADRLIELLSDPEAAVAMGQRAKAEAERRFRPAQVMERTWNVYESVLAERSGR